MSECALTHAQLTQNSELFNCYKKYEKIIRNTIKIQFISSVCIISTFNFRILESAEMKKRVFLNTLSWSYCKHFSCRAISVILGDRWKKMKNEERRMYTLEAKALAEEQKRLNPDCWKRKRTNSVCLWSDLFCCATKCVPTAARVGLFRPNSAVHCCLDSPNLPIPALCVGNRPGEALSLSISWGFCVFSWTESECACEMHKLSFEVAEFIRLYLNYVCPFPSKTLKLPQSCVLWFSESPFASVKVLFQFCIFYS